MIHPTAIKRRDKLNVMSESKEARYSDYLSIMFKTLNFSLFKATNKLNDSMIH